GRLPEQLLRPPEAAEPEHRGLEALRPRALQRGAEHRVGRRDRHRLIRATGQGLVGVDHLGLAREQHAGKRTAVLIRPLDRLDLDAALALNNANLPAVGEVDAAELARLHGMATVAL